MKNSSAKILVLGGDVEVSQDIENILGVEGFRAKVAPSLESSIRLLETGVYGLMIVDLSMFSGNEVNLLRHIREKNKEISILGLGNLSKTDAVLDSLREWLAGYMQKPIVKDLLLDTVRHIEQERQLPGSLRETLLVTIGKRIRVERKKQSLTLRQVAGKARLSVSLLSQIERAESAASVSSLYKIALALNTSLRSFFDGY